MSEDKVFETMETQTDTCSDIFLSAIHYQVWLVYKDNATGNVRIKLISILWLASKYVVICKCSFRPTNNELPNLVMKCIT